MITNTLLQIFLNISLVLGKTKHIKCGIRYQYVKRNGPPHISFILVRMIKPSFTIFVFWITAAKMPNKIKKGKLKQPYNFVFIVDVFFNVVNNHLIFFVHNHSYVSYPKQSTDLTFHYPAMCQVFNEKAKTKEYNYWIINQQLNHERESLFLATVKYPLQLPLFK